MTMSLLEFAKNNKEYLDLFTKLTDKDLETRSKTVEIIIKHVNEKHQQLNDKDDDLNSIPLIKYTLQRLIRGLSSSSHANRIAFANTLSQVLLHCKFINTPFIVQTVNNFCANEKAKQSTIVESLLLIRNLFILILFQTQRIFELSWNDLHAILTRIVGSAQAKNLIDLSCQTMICLLDVMETGKHDHDEWKKLLIAHRTDLMHLCCKLIPTPINSFKLVTLTQIKLILRIYNNHNMFSSTWNLNDCDLNNLTVEILPKKIDLVYEFLLKPLKKSETSLCTSIVSNIYNDKKMWKALICLYCTGGNISSQDSKFSECCNTLFYFVNTNLLKPKYVSFVSVLCNTFIFCGMVLKVNSDILFAHILSPSVLRFIAKYGLKYKNNKKQNKECKEAFDFMVELNSLSNGKIYGSIIKSLLISSSVNIGLIGKINATGNENENISDENKANLKTVMFYTNVFWRNNADITRNRMGDRKQLLSAERDCVNSIKSVANIMQQFIKKNWKKNHEKNDNIAGIKWLKESVYFFVRIVFFKASRDIVNRSRFEKILFLAQKVLRISVQNAWNTLASNNKNAFIGYFNDALREFEQEKYLKYRVEDSFDLKAQEIVNKIEKINVEYLSVKHKDLLKDFVKFIAIYYFFNNETSDCSVSILSQLDNEIIDKISDLSATDCGDALMDIIIECLHSDDMFLSCLSRHILLEFADLFHSNTFAKLLAFISPETETETNEKKLQEKGDDDKDEDDDEDMDIDENDQKEAEFIEEDDSDDEDDSDSDEDSDEEEGEEDGDSDDSDSDEEDESDSDSDLSFEVTDYGEIDEKLINLETDTVKYAELERLDKALIFAFRQRKKNSKICTDAKQSRFEKRVFHHLLLFVKRHKTSALLLIMLTPLMMSFWNASQSKSNKSKKTQHQKREPRGLPGWRFNNKIREQQNEVTKINMYEAVSIINAILSHSPKLMVIADKNDNEIKLEWLKDLIYDIIALISQSQTIKHEMFGIKILCYVCKIYQLKCSNNVSNNEYIWNKIDLNQKEEERNEDIVWLLELWYFELQCLMKQPHRTWYFSRDFFEIFVRKNTFICWKLLYDAFDVFDICKKAWTETQMFLLLGTVSKYCIIENDVDNKVIKYILTGIANKMANPLKKCLNQSMDVSKTMDIVHNVGRFVRKLKRFKIEGNGKEQIVDVLAKSKEEWNTLKYEKKKKKKKLKYEEKKKRKNNKTSADKQGMGKIEEGKTEKGNKGKNRNKGSKNNQKKRKMKFNQISKKRKFNNNSKKRKFNKNPKKKRKLS